jgi:hypothetical protein
MKTPIRHFPYEIRKIKYGSLAEQKVYDIYYMMVKEFWLNCKRVAQE